jgi:hypothetical protein
VVVLNLNIPADGETGLCALDPEFITYTGTVSILAEVRYVEDASFFDK